MHLLQINGYPLLAGVILEAWAFVSWHYRSAKSAKSGQSGKATPPAWRLCIGGFLLTIGFPVWLDSLAGITATKIGLGVLVVVTLILGWMFWHEAIRDRNRHPIRTPVVGWLFADAAFLSIASASRIVSHAQHMAPSTGKAIAATMTQIRSGRAASMLPTSMALAVAVVGVLVIGGIIWAARAVHQRGSGSSGSGTGGSSRPGSTRRQAVPTDSRRPPSLMPGGRK